jgi:acetyl esterase
MNRPRTPALILLACALFSICLALPARADTDLSGQRIYRVMCVANPTNSLAWQFPLWEKLFSAGYLVEFIGSKTNTSRIGPLKHEPFTDKTVANLRKQSPDIVLLDSDVDAAATHAFREANPQIAILITRPSSNPEKMADRWFAALKKILEPPKQSYRPKIVTYKNATGTNLTLHIFNPPRKFHGPHPAIVFFFGGGWKVGTPIQFYRECAHFAEEGFVAISADYRIESVEHTTPFESVSDGKSAIRYVRAHAKKLGIDPDRIVGAGASAGGQVAAAAATVKSLDDPQDNLSISPRPNALILWYGVIDNGPGGYGYSRIKERYLEISPLHNVDAHTPPTLFFLGTKDSLIPVPTAANFKARIDKAGGRCELKLFENAPHGFGDYRKGDNQLRRDCITAADEFLLSLNFTPATEHSR